MRSIFGTEIPQWVQWLLALLLVLGLVVLFGVLLKRFAGGRLRVKGQSGRARQPRLGIVDIYDLDRQRQLVLLRRDNVEHLVMIGGPNDVVIEAAISRAGQRVPLQPVVVEPEPEPASEPVTTAPEPVRPSEPPAPVVLPTKTIPPAQPPMPAPEIAATAVAAAVVAETVSAKPVAAASQPVPVAPPVPVFETLVQRTQATVAPLPPVEPTSAPLAPPVEPRTEVASPSVRPSAPEMSEDEIDAVARELESALLAMAPATAAPVLPVEEVPSPEPMADPVPKPAMKRPSPLPADKPVVMQAPAPAAKAPEPAPEPASAMATGLSTPAAEPPVAKLDDVFEPTASTPAEPPASQPETSAKPAIGPAPAPAVKPATSQAQSTDGTDPTTADPFSVGAIEAEFARLLNRSTKPKS